MVLSDTEKKRLVQHGSAAADMIAIKSMSMPITEAERTSLIVQAALECLEANGLIQFVSPEDWPEYVVMDPPYRVPSGW